MIFMPIIHSNLTENSVYLNSKNDLIQSVIVINSWGQNVLEIDNVQQQNYRLNIGELPSGTYYISIECQSLKRTNSILFKL